MINLYVCFRDLGASSQIPATLFGNLHTRSEKPDRRAKLLASWSII